MLLSYYLFEGKFSYVKTGLNKTKEGFSLETSPWPTGKKPLKAIEE